ncbi:Acetylglutamate kinase [subsurface metagenome]
MDKVIVTKIGSVALSPEDTSIDDIVALQKQGRRIIVMHGGGKLITKWLEKLGLTTRFIRGERVTDQVVNKPVATHGTSEKRMPRSKPLLVFLFIPA